MSAYGYVTQTRMQQQKVLQVKKRKKRSIEAGHHITDGDFDWDHLEGNMFHYREKRQAITGTNCTAYTKNSTIDVVPYGNQAYEIVMCENEADMSFSGNYFVLFIFEEGNLRYLI